MLKILRKLSLVLFRVLLILVVLSGLRTYYHFFWEPTGITLKDTGKPVFRYQLLDILIMRVVQPEK